MRRAAAAAAAAAALAAVSACGAGQVAATANQVTATGGANGEVGEIAVRDAQIVFDLPVPGDEAYAPGDEAPLQVTIVNTGDAPDRLLAVTSEVAASVLIAGDTALPGGQVLTAGYDAPISSVTLPDATAIEIVLVDVGTPLRAGLTYPVLFTFERAGQVRLDVPIENPAVLPPRAFDDDPEPGQ